MSENHLYEYAVIRVVPIVEREEFLNAGIILFSRRAQYICVIVSLDERKLRIFSEELDIDEIRLNLASFEKIAHSMPGSGPIGEMDLASRFRWLTAVRSSVIQTSHTHAGLCSDLAATAKRLFDELVL